MTNGSDARTTRLGVLLAILMLVLGLAVLAGIVWAIRALIRLSPETLAAIVAATAAILVALVSAFAGRHIERSREIEQEHRRQKFPMYEEFMAFWFKVMASQKPGVQQVSEQQGVQFMTEWTQKLVLWGGDAAIKEMSAFWQWTSRLEDAASADPIEWLVRFEDLLLAIRRDLGHSNKGIARGELLGSFVMDAGQYFPRDPSAAPQAGTGP